MVKDFINDIKNDTSHSLSYLTGDNVEDTLSLLGIRIRNIFAPLLRFVYGFSTKYKLIVDSRAAIKTDKVGKIFVVNHRQGDDMVLSAKAIGKSGYFVFGNKTLALESFSNGYGLWGYGMILLDRDNPISRKSCYEKMKYVLQNGGNIIIFPEGYWNLADNGLADKRHMADDHNSENWLIQDFNVGAIRLAREIGSEIVPIVLHYDENEKKRCYAKRGKAIKVSKEDDIFVKKNEILETMTTMYWELMEKYSTYYRHNLEKNGSTLKEQWEELKKQVISACDIEKVGYKLDLQDEKYIGKAKVQNGVTTNEEAFSFLNHLEANRDNAFLLQKKLPGIRR